MRQRTFRPACCQQQRLVTLLDCQILRTLSSLLIGNIDRRIQLTGGDLARDRLGHRVSLGDGWLGRGIACRAGETDPDPEPERLMKLVEDVTHHGEHDHGEVEQGPGQGRQDQPVTEPGEEQALGVGRTLGEQEQMEQQ